MSKSSVLTDEKNPIWIKIYKFIVIFGAIAILIGGIIWGCDEATYTYYYGYKTGFDFLTFLMYAALSVVAAAVEWVSGMLVVNFLSNVQTIREKLEEEKA